MSPSGKKRRSPGRRFTASFIAFIFLCNTTIPAQAQSEFFLPNPGTMVVASPNLIPPVIKGIKIFPDNPLRFDFIIDAGPASLKDGELRQEADKLIKYFLASLTIPEDDLWVNLSPYEKDRIIPEDLSFTDMGRDLLGQDYVLKQLAASLTYPEKQLGQEFWKRVYEKAQALYGAADIPVNTFNKVWVVPEKAVVYENGDTAFVIESHLKVMLEGDYLALKENFNNKNQGMGQLKETDVKALSDVSSIAMKEVVIPEIEKEVNEGKNFALLRQVYYSLILATWFKRNLKESLLGKIYVGQGKLDGVDIDDKNVKKKIYEKYLEAFKMGVYNYIKEDYDPVTQEMTPRKYFSGGFEFIGKQMDKALLVVGGPENASKVALSSNTYQVGTIIEPRINTSSNRGSSSVIQAQQQNVLITQTAHKRNVNRLRRILRLIANSQNIDFPSDTPENELMEFLTAQLLQRGLASQELEGDNEGNLFFVIRVKPEAETDRLGEAIIRWVINPEEGMGAKAVNFKSSSDGSFKGEWIIIGFEKELNEPSVLHHEKREIYFREKYPDKPWSSAHNMAVLESGEGVLIDENVISQEEGGETSLGTGIFDWLRRWRSGRRVQQPVIAAVSHAGGTIARVEQPAVAYDRTVDTDMTLDYGGLEKWNLERILIDLVQNHKPADAKGTRMDVIFYLKNGKKVSLLDSRVESLRAEEVDFIEISDDGIGYDYQHLKYFLTTKGSEEEGGKFGEGLKIATAAALKRGMQIEFRSRSWQSRAEVVDKTLNEGYRNQIRTRNIAFQVRDVPETKGSATIIRNPDQQVLDTAKQLTDLVISLRGQYRTMTKLEGAGEIIEATDGQSGVIYVKGNKILSLPNRLVGVYNPPLFNYNFFDDTNLNRDRDYLPFTTITSTVERILLQAVTPEVARIIIQNSENRFDGERRVTIRKNRFLETELRLWDGGLRSITEAGKEIWKQMFYNLFGEGAIIGELGSDGKLSATTEQAIREGKKVVFLAPTVTGILEYSGVATAKSLYYEKENRISTGLTLRYREAAWNYERILLDAVQNHLQTDSGARTIKVEFSVKGQEETWIDLENIGQHRDEDIVAIRVSDDGTGYDYRLLGLMYSTKRDVVETAGEWGDGLKLLSTAALRQGLGIELKSRNWRAKAVTVREAYTDAEGKYVTVDALGYDMTHMRGKGIVGSETIFTNLKSEFLQPFRQLPEKIIALNKNYRPVSRTEAGEITGTKPVIYVQGIEVKDAIVNHRVLLGYNFLNIPGLIPSPDRNIVHPQRLREAVGTMMAQTESVEALWVVIKEAIDNGRNYHPEFQNVTKLPGYRNQATWGQAWDRTISEMGWNPSKVVLGTRRTLNDPDAQILLRNMGYTIVFMDGSIGQVIHSLGAHLDYEILDPVFEYVKVDDLSQDEIKILSLRTTIDRKVAAILGVTFEPSPVEIFGSVKSKLTGDELEGWRGYWDPRTQKIGIARRQLQDAFNFGMTYLEEVGHRLSQAGDHTREFTNFFRNALLTQIYKEAGVSFQEDNAQFRETPKNFDQALVSPQEKLGQPPGGIDLNPNMFDLQTRGQGINFNVPLNYQDLESVPINGFSPMILSIVPISSMSLSFSLDLSAKH